MSINYSRSDQLHLSLFHSPNLIHPPIQSLLPFKCISNPSSYLHLYYYHFQLRLHQQLTYWYPHPVSTTANLQAIFNLEVKNLSLISKSELYLPTLFPNTQDQKQNFKMFLQSPTHLGSTYFFQSHLDLHFMSSLCSSHMSFLAYPFLHHVFCTCCPLS